MTHEEFEKIVMNKLLGDEDEILAVFREQYQHAIVVSRKFTGRGFFTTFDTSCTSANSLVNGRIDDVVAKFCDTEAYYFILYIKEGRIDTLEGFSTLNEWKSNYDEAEVEYCFSDKRDFELK